MASIVMSGGGVVALTTAMLLADDGHEVTVLERDPAPFPDPSQAWDNWERRGVNQFRLPHFFMPRFRIEIEQALPRLTKALDEAGALRFNPVVLMPAEFSGGWREGDEDFEALTGRRSVMEAAIAAVAESTPGVTVRRGVACTGLVTDAPPGSTGSTGPGTQVPHVVGVRTESGESVTADLVVDATGRRSPLPKWLDEIGAAAPLEELEDSGFVYYGRHFRSSDGSVPPSLGPGIQPYGTISSLTLPADNGTWSVAIIASSNDSALRGLRDKEQWTAVVRSLPLVAHWLDGEPIEDRIVTIAKIEDRYRRYVVDGQPIATGVVPLADAWACTNPSLGRGVAIGVVHGLALRDVLRDHDVADATSFVKAFDDATVRSAEPWYRATLSFDRHRLAEIDAGIKGEPYETEDPAWEISQSLNFAAGQDPDCLRAALSIGFVLRTPDDVLSDPGLFEKIVELGSGWREAPSLGPDRGELVSLASS